MAEDDLDLSGFEEHSDAAASAGGRKRRSGSGGGGRSAGRRPRRRWPWLAAGVVLGVVGAMLVPDLVGPYLPGPLRPSLEEVRGPVLGKRADGQRLLLTVNTERGALLATFRQRVPEIDLLVDEGDTIALALQEYSPLVEDPVLRAVSKGPGPVRGATDGPADDGAASGPGEAAEPVEEAAPPDTAVRETTSPDTAEPGGAGPAPN